MKHMMMVFSLLVLSTAAFAAPKHIALCEMNQSEDEIVNSDLSPIKAITIREATGLTDFELKLVNRYLVTQEYTSHDLSFAEIKAMFSDNGEYQYDYLNISSYQAKSTGNVYIQVHSYPGDNQYGMIFDVQGNLIANINDGDIAIIENGKDLYCYDLVP